MLQGKKIVIAVTGSIAAYKIPVLVRLLVKAGAEVKLLMTPAAGDFVSRLTLATLSRNPVPVALFEAETWANHVMLGRWADIMLVAPLSCNTLAKMAQGLCDNLVLATYLSATCPVMAAPAMDEDMWHHPATRANLDTILAQGVRLLPVGYGELASGLVGEGRMAEPEEMVAFLEAFFRESGQLKGKKALVTAGPTYEAIDPVRFIGNHSSGKMGYAIAAALQARGAEVTLVSGPVSLPAPQGVKLRKVVSAHEMYQACIAEDQFDVGVMAAAVADYTPEEVAATKIKKGAGEGMALALRKTADILGTLGKAKKNGQFLVGFALETDHEEENAIKKLREKGADLIVLNSLKNPGAGFGHDTNQVSFYFSDGKEQHFGLDSKAAVARQIVDTITENIA